MKKLSYQLILIYTLVITLLVIVFATFLNAKLNDIYKTENYTRMEQILNGLTLNSASSYLPKDVSTYIKNMTTGTTQKTHSNEYLIDDQVINQIFNEITSEFPNRLEKNYGNQHYYFSGVKKGQNKYLVCTNDTYINQRLSENLMQILLIFFIILILGNAILIVWSRWIVKRILFIKKNLNNQETIESIHTKKLFNDEITDLTRTIFGMRLEIYQNEHIKQEMLQNISHDFKTPIAVIKSYAEAIRDQVVEIDQLEIILKQTDLLNKKVIQLLEITKLDFLATQKIDVSPINVTHIVKTILVNYQLNTQIKVELDLTELIFEGNYENFYTVFDNILDNAYRYAKTKIKISTTQNSISFYNDGEPIHVDFIDNIFKPYEKSNRGKFGLGMAIVKRVTDLYQLKIEIKNLTEGVIFTISREGE